MAKTKTVKKGIWAYISQRGDSAKYQFEKRWPVDVAKVLGKVADRGSLDTKDPREAELKAVERLQLHEAKIVAIRGGQPFHDLSKAVTLADLTEEQSYLIDTILTEANDEGFNIGLPVGMSQNALLMAYTHLNNGKFDGQLMSLFQTKNVLIAPGSEVYEHCVMQLREMLRVALGMVTKQRDVDRIEAVDPRDRSAFETSYFETPDKKRPRPMMTVTALWERYKTNHMSDPAKANDTRQIEEITRRQNYVDAFVDFLGSDLPVNWIDPTQVIDFLRDLAKIPSRKNSKERQMTFTQLVASNHGRATITKATAIEWWSRLNLIFSDGEIEFGKKPFHYENPWKGTKKFVKGAASTAKRDWYEDEIAAMFEQEEFTDPSKRNSFFYSVLAGVSHGNRLSEFHSRLATDLRQDKDGTWVLDITDAKTPTSNRTVPISQVLINAGFIEWAMKNREAGATYLFPDENHNDPDSRDFSRTFGKWLTRRKLNDPARTLHNLRDTFETAAYVTEVPRWIMKPSLVVRKITGHAPRDDHEGYNHVKLKEMKVVIDAIRIPGLPYDRFGM